MTAIDQVTPLAAAPRRSWRWRRLYFIGAAVAVGGLVSGLAFAFQTANGTGSGIASTGSVALTVNAPATHACTYGSLTPGDTIGTPPCTFSVNYSGSLPAYMALNVLIATKAQAPGTRPLYNPSDSTNDLQLTIKDNQTAPVTYVTPSTSFGSTVSCPSPYSGGYTCYQLNDLLVSTGTFTNASAPITFTLTGSLPKITGNPYQNATASVVMTALAVQSQANTLTCTSTPTPGKACVPSGIFTWS